jgi:hypothetical protein
MNQSSSQSLKPTKRWRRINFYVGKGQGDIQGAIQKIKRKKVQEFEKLVEAGL